MADETNINDNGPEPTTPVQPQTTQEEEQSFAELLEASDQSMGANVRVGDKIKGEIIAIEPDSVFVDTGSKVDGVVEADELLDDDGNMPYEIGDEIELYVVDANPGLIRLSKALAGIGGLEMLREAFENCVPVEGKVAATNKGGFQVEVLQRRAFCPVSQIDSRYVEDAEAYVGETFSFLIIKLEEKGRNIVLSRRQLLEREQNEAAEAFRQEMQAGDVLDGTVTRLAPFGAFVELAPGVEGMVHVSELGWSRVDDPKDVVAEGEQLTVKILSMEPTDKPGQLRISLSAKQAQDDPWDSVGGKYAPGQKLTGTVTRLADFGAFVEVEPGVEGLVHISELSFERRVNRPDEVVKPGEAVTVVVKDLDLERRRLSLSLREAAGDPWQEVPDRFKPGETVQGTVEKHERFGVFINLMPGVTGLLPKSMLSRSARGKEIENLAPGSPVAVVIEEVKPEERRITLGAGDESEARDWKKHAGKAAPAQKSDAGGFGTLGDKLQAAMKAQKK